MSNVTSEYEDENSENEIDDSLDDDYNAVIILQIDERKNWLSPEQRIDLSKRLVRLIGAEHFHVGRSSPTSNELKMAIEEFEPISRELAADIQMPEVAGLKYWVGQFVMHNPRNKDAQCIQIKVRGCQYAGKETPTEDWPLIAMIYDWVKVNDIKARFIIGSDIENIPFIEMSDSTRDVIHSEYLRSGPADIIRNVAGEIVSRNEEWKADHAHPDHYYCAACADVMAFRGPHFRLEEEYDEENDQVITTKTDTGGERHECRACGERAVVYKDEFGQAFAHWMGSSGSRRMAGDIRLAVFEPSVRGVDLSREMKMPNGDVQILASWTENVSRTIDNINELMH